MGAKANRRRARKKRQRARQAAEQSAFEMRMDGRPLQSTWFDDANNAAAYAEWLDQHGMVSK